jgi:hypothetical protein
MKNRGDSRYIKFERRLDCLKHERELIEEQLAALQLETRADCALRMERLDDAEDFDRLLRDHLIRTDIGLPRMFRGPFLIKLWSVVRDGVTEVAIRLQFEHGLTVRLNDMSGGFLQRAESYFEHELGLPLTMSTDARDWFRRLRTLRDLFALRDGQTKDASAEVLDSLERWNREGLGVENSLQDRVTVSEGFLGLCNEQVEAALRSLFTRAQRPLVAPKGVSPRG